MNCRKEHYELTTSPDSRIESFSEALFFVGGTLGGSANKSLFYTRWWNPRQSAWTPLQCMTVNGHIKVWRCPIKGHGLMWRWRYGQFKVRGCLRAKLFFQFSFWIMSYWLWIVTRIDYESDRVFGRYVQNRFCSRIVFGRMMLKIDYELVFYRFALMYYTIIIGKNIYF